MGWLGWILALVWMGWGVRGAWVGEAKDRDHCARGEVGAWLELEGDGRLWGDRWGRLEGVTTPEGPFLGQVWVPVAPLRTALEQGRRLRVRGPLRCEWTARNGPVLGGQAWPAVRAVGRHFEFRPTGRSSLRARWAFGFRRYLQWGLGGWPRLHGFVVAVWTGDGSGLDPGLQRLYREGGLLHVLALSGQHVGVLALGLGFVVENCVRLVGNRGPLGGAWALGVIARGRTLWAALLLWGASFGLPPLLRAGAMAGFTWALRRRGIRPSPQSLLWGSAGVILALYPAWLGQVSFLLSLGATALWMALGSAGGGWRLLTLGWWLCPLGAHAFGQVGWGAPLYNALLVGLWGAVLLPAGLTLGLVAPALPPWVLGGVDRLWGAVVFAHGRWLGDGAWGYVWVWRPTLTEVLGWVALGLFWIEGRWVNGTPWRRGRSG